MLSKRGIIASAVSLGLLLGVTSRTVAQMPHETHRNETSQTSEFKRIDQPLWIKSVVTVSGLGLIGLEIWWFLLSKPKSKKADDNREVQEANIVMEMQASEKK